MDQSRAGVQPRARKEYPSENKPEEESRLKEFILLFGGRPGRINDQSPEEFFADLEQWKKCLER